MKANVGRNSYFTGCQEARWQDTTQEWKGQAVDAIMFQQYHKWGQPCRSEENVSDETLPLHLFRSTMFFPTALMQLGFWIITCLRRVLFQVASVWKLQVRLFHYAMFGFTDKLDRIQLIAMSLSGLSRDATASTLANKVHFIWNIGIEAASYSAAALRYRHRQDIFSYIVDTLHRRVRKGNLW